MWDFANVRMGLPVVNIGDRQHRRCRAENVTDVAYNENAILKATQKAVETPSFKPSSLYGDGKSGERIANILAETELTYHKTITY